MATTLLAAAMALDCRWTVNTHQHTDFFSQLSAQLRQHLAPTTTLYPGTGHGFIGYPTELFLSLPTHAPDRATGCQLINDTSAYEPVYRSQASPTIDDCCALCTTDGAKCSFAVWKPHAAGPKGGKCYLTQARTLTPRPEAGSIIVSAGPAPPAPPPVYWRDAWEHNLATLPGTMASYAAAGLNGTTASLLMLDYEPPWRPCWNFTTNYGERAQPRWAAQLAAVHTPKLDTNWTALVGWTPPAGATDWASLSAAEQQALQAVSWDFFCRQYLTAGVRAIKTAMPAAVDLSVWCVPDLPLHTRARFATPMRWRPTLRACGCGHDRCLPPLIRNWPFKFGSKPPGWDALMDEMGWLWAELPIFMPDLYQEFYSGPEAERPAALATCAAQNASVTATYFQSNIDTARRLRAKFNPKAKIFLSVWWHYMCAQHVTGDPGYFVKDGNLPAMFGASGHDGLALWGSVGDFPGEDANATQARLDVCSETHIWHSYTPRAHGCGAQVKEYLGSTWAPLIAANCDEVPGTGAA